MQQIQIVVWHCLALESIGRFALLARVRAGHDSAYLDDAGKDVFWKTSGRRYSAGCGWFAGVCAKHENGRFKRVDYFDGMGHNRKASNLTTRCFKTSGTEPHRPKRIGRCHRNAVSRLWWFESVGSEKSETGFIVFLFFLLRPPLRLLLL